MIYSFLLRMVFISGNDVVTPSQLVTAFKYFGGLQNSLCRIGSILILKKTRKSGVENWIGLNFADF